ncbi:MAG: ATP-binding cassette domain-containing protein [Candidatus Diapherotrites archaeon]|nr:ATP-binding cassette domain-containing protein [Candidatus Diapherotrites archaeon]
MDDENIALHVDNIEKTFGNKRAVSKMSFQVKEKEIFGLLGPNGAGKTTTIRMLLNLIDDYDGKVEIFGGKFTEKTKNTIGYLPEERGLYKNQTSMDVIKYLAALKGIDAKTAEQRATKLMKEMELIEYKDKRIFELSKGTQQKIQIISTIVPEPDLLILDEPFSGLDPLSIKFVINVIKHQNEQGKTIILSTHNLNIAEAVCDRMIVINKGRRVLYGHIDDIKDRYSQNSAIIEYRGNIPKVPGIKKIVQKEHGKAELLLEVEVTPEEILRLLVNNGLAIRKFESQIPTLESIFLTVVEAEKWIKY